MELGLGGVEALHSQFLFPASHPSLTSPLETLGISNRKIIYRLYPTATQTRHLESHLYLHQRLYNAALKHRRMNYDLLGKSVGFFEQAKLLTKLRACRSEYAALNAQSCQATLKRVDRAFQNFFRRIKHHQRPAGFPRFKSINRYTGWGYAKHGSGWKLLSGPDLRHGRIRISGIGHIKIRGGARTMGLPKTCEVFQKGMRWYASITIKCQPVRHCGKKAAGLDWGTETFLTIVEEDGIVRTIENPRSARKASTQIKFAQRSLSRKKKGSRNRQKIKQHLADLHRRIGNRRKEFLHQTTNMLIKAYGLLATEALHVKNLTAKGGSRKRGLNREILDTAPGTFLNMLACKAEEAGGWYHAFSSKSLKPSQTCHKCGRQEAKLLSQRRHVCSCGVNCGRDENAAKVLLHWALVGNAPGSERARCGETSAGLGSTAKVKLVSGKQESVARIA